MRCSSFHSCPPSLSQVKVRDAASQNMPWPNAGQLGDPLRAMIVCGEGEYSQPWRAWEKIRDAFDVRDDHGHVKPNFRAVSYTHLTLPTNTEV